MEANPQPQRTIPAITMEGLRFIQQLLIIHSKDKEYTLEHMIRIHSIHNMVEQSTIRMYIQIRLNIPTRLNILLLTL